MVTWFLEEAARVVELRAGEVEIALVGDMKPEFWTYEKFEAFVEGVVPG